MITNVDEPKGGKQPLRTRSRSSNISADSFNLMGCFQLLDRPWYGCYDAVDDDGDNDCDCVNSDEVEEDNHHHIVVSLLSELHQDDVTCSRR